ncbi:MAG: amino acid ABC transporter substrate-binding protein [Desulfobacter sp.]|nr:MAG: amino acid ABC transporter substrate-binding protein [Desulfobacter sp.]
MNNKRTLFAIAILMFTALTLATGCNEKEKKQDTALDQIKKAGVITVATSPDYPPFETKDEKGKIVGFDIDLIKAVAEKIGVKTDIKGMPFDRIITEVGKGMVDIGMSGLSITGARKIQVQFSTPYIVTSQVVMVAGSSPIQTLGNMDGKIVAAVKATTAIDSAQLIDGAQLKAVDSLSTAVSLLETGKADAVVLEDAIANTYVSAKGFRILITPLQREEIAVAMGKDKAALQREIDTALSELIEDGTYDRLKAKWQVI